MLLTEICMNAFFFFYSCNKLFCFEILQSHREANILGIKPSQVFEVSLWESRQRADDSLNLSCGAETALEKTSITVDLFWWHFRGLAEPEKQRLCDTCLVNSDSVQSQLILPYWISTRWRQEDWWFSHWTLG